MANYPELVPHLADLRKECGLTRAALAERTGISKTLITRYENGTLCPYGEKAETLAKALGVSVDTLIGKYNTRLWSTVLENSEAMFDLFGSKGIKRYLEVIREVFKI